MKNALLILILTITLCSCKNDLKNQAKAVIEKPEIKKELLFSIYNSTEFELKDITVGLPDTVLTFNRLEKHSQTEWIVQTAARRCRPGILPPHLLQ